MKLWPNTPKPLNIEELFDLMYRIKLERRKRLIPPGALVRLNPKLLK